MDILQLGERIRQSIQLGESQFREFKSAFEGPVTNKKPRNPKDVARDIAETLVAFGNADGGELLFGVEDDGTITGLPYSKETTAALAESYKDGVHRDAPLSSVLHYLITVDDQQVLYFSVEKGTSTVHQTSDGKCLRRRDRENRPASFEQLRFERQEQISREYDRQFADGAQVSDLNLELVTAVAEDLVKGWSPEKCLQYLGLAEYASGLLRLRRAAVLLFAKDVRHWHPRCQVRVVRIPGTELKTGKEYIVKSDETASGNIMELMNVAWEKLRPHLVETKLTEGAVFREHIMYPEDACREALTNAIAHRDYSVEGQGIEILIFDDRMEVHSPGALLSTIKQVELMKLQGIHESRNALIARVLREVGYMREMGEGLRRIFFLMRDADLVPPELHSEPSGFSIILRYKSVFSEEDQRWLEGYKPLNLTREEMFVALLGKDGVLISPQQIYDRLNLVDWDIYRSVITQAQIKGLLYNVLTEREKKSQAKAKKISQREVPRLTVRDSGECEKSLSELLTALQTTGATPLFGYSDATRILNSLSARNLYRTNPGHITKLLQLIGLLDENKSPTKPMQSLWGGQAAKPIRPTRQRISAPPLAVAREPAVPGYGKTLFVGNVDYDATNDELQSFLSQFGIVVSVSIPKDFVTKRGRGFGFVTTSTREEAENLRKQADGRLFRERPLHFDWASYR